MTLWLDNPFVQSAALPFLLAVVLAALLGFLLPRWQGAAASLSFYPAAMLIAGAQLFPLNSTRKILLLGVIALVIAMALSWRQVSAYQRAFFLLIFITLAAGWVFWALLLRSEGLDVWLLAAAGLAYLFFMVVLFDNQRIDVQEQMLGVSMFSVGVAVVATIGATALLGQLAGALAAATAGLLLVVMLSKKAIIDDMLLLPVMLMAGLLGLAAIVYASLLWQSLLCLMAIPVVSRLPLRVSNVWIKLFIKCLMMLMVVVGAAYFEWTLSLVGTDNGYY